MTYPGTLSSILLKFLKKYISKEKQQKSKYQEILMKNFMY